MRQVLVPDLTNDAFVFWVLADREDFRVPFQRFVTRVDVQCPEAPSEGLMLFFGHILVAEEDYQILVKRAFHLAEPLLVDIFGQIDPADYGPAGTRQFLDFNMLIAHLILPNSLA